MGSYHIRTSVTVLGVEIPVEIEYNYTVGFGGSYQEPPEPDEVEIQSITTEFGHDLYDTCATYREKPEIVAAKYHRAEYFRRVETWADPVEQYRQVPYIRFEVQGPTLIDELNEYIYENHDRYQGRYYDDD